MRIRIVESRDRDPELLSGIIAVKAVFLLIPVLLFTALAADIGMLSVTNGRLQQAADAAALSSAQALVQSMDPLTNTADYHYGRELAGTITGRHLGGRSGATLALSDADVEYLYTNLSNGKLVATASPSGDGPPNAVRVTVRRDNLSNGPMELQFARVMGAEYANLDRSATAAFFPATEIGHGAEILPIAVDATIWTALRMGNDLVNLVVPMDVSSRLDNVRLLDFLGLTGSQRLLDRVGVPFDLNGNPLMVLDRQTFNPQEETITSGADGVWESLFLPHQLEKVFRVLPLVTQLTGVKYVPGNMVLLDLGRQRRWRTGMNLARIERQLVSGLDFRDVAGVNELNGREGDTLRTPFVAPGQYYLPESLKEELTASIGKPKILFLYATVPGVLTTVGDLLQQPTDFVIVGWVGAVLTDVNFDSLVQYVKIQPATYNSFSLGKGSGTTGDFSSGVIAGPYLID